MKYRLAALISSIVLLFNCLLQGQEVGIGEWRDHLPYDYATNVEEFQSIIYCSTPYSMFYFNRDDNSVHRLSKVNGLSDLGVNDISLNENQKILVIAYANTNLDLLYEDFSIVNIPDIKRKEILGNKTINSVLNYGNYAYLCCGFGIVVLNLEKREIKDTYYIGPGGGALNVLELTHNDTAFFAATEDGIYTADINDPNLTYYGNWHKMLNNPNPNGYFTHVLCFNDKLLINQGNPSASEDDLYVLENGEWRQLESVNTSKTYRMRISGDKLVVSYSYFVMVYNSDLTGNIKIYTYGDSSPAPSDAFIGTDGNYWIADRSKGLVKSWNSGFDRQFIKPSGAPTADIFDMTASDGKLYVVPGGLTSTWGNLWKSARVYSLIDETWKTYDSYGYDGLDSLRDMVAVTIDPQNSDHVLAGSWNRGMVEFKDQQLLDIYNARGNSSLMPNMIEGYPVVKVGGMVYDDNHNLWMTNSGAENIISVWRNAGTNEESWQSYNLGSNMSGIDVRKIIVDSYNQKWMLPRTTQGNPYYALVFNEQNTGSGQVRGLKSGAGYGNLPGTNVFCIAEDLEGEVWVGTDEGVAVFYSPQDVLSGNSDAEQILVNFDGYNQYLLETEIVKAVAVDGANRKWFGTERAGVFLLSADGTKQIHHFTEDNSPLFSNNITSLAINGATGEVFIGTAKGLISYKSDATDGDNPTGSVYAYPNPVRPGYSGPIAIKNLPTDAIVKITDITGTLIYETRAEGGQATWNGSNFDGRRANTGVFLVFISLDDGSDKQVTKILFIQ
jgi:hypothetical protein